MVRSLVMMVRSVTEYNEMLNLLSESEKNKIFYDHFSELFRKKLSITDTLSRRIENALYSLINSYDTEEKKLLDQIKKEEFVIEAKGDTKLVEKNYREYLQENSRDNTIGAFLAEMALSSDKNVSIAVRKFAISIIGKYCKDCIKEYAQSYRKKEKKQYEITVDDFVCVTDENDKTVEKKLRRHYEEKIRQAVKNNKTYKTSILIGILALLCGIIMGFVLFKANLESSQKFALVIVTLILLGVFAGSIYAARYQKEKIRERNKKAIQNGVDFLKEIMEEMRKWRNDYHNADKVNNDIIELFEKGGNV